MKSPSCDCSIIIPTRNRRSVLARTLRLIAALPDDHFEVEVIDNGSDDGTGELRSEFAGIRWTDLGRNVGAAARNIGAEQARGRILFMLDDDSWPDPGVISKAVRRFDRRPDLGALACRVLLADSGGRHDAGGVPGIFFNCGGFVRRDAFLSVGGYPPEFEYYAEEYELCCKLWQRGFRVEPHGDLVVHHRRTRMNRDNNRMLRLLVRNNVSLWSRFALPEMRDDLIASTMERYRRVAVLEDAMDGFEAGLKEAAALLRGSTGGEGPALSREQFESLMGIGPARRVLREWADKRARSRIGIWSRGKGCELLVEIVNSLGLEIVAVYDSQRSIGNANSWRHVALKCQEAFNPDEVDGLLIGTLSPGVAEDLVLDLSQRYASLCVISAAPWCTTGLDSLPTASLTV